MKQKSLYNKLIEYGKNGKYPFHMPGHKRNDCLLPDIDPFSIDITEIDGFDNLHHAEGIIKQAMEKAAKYYGTNKTWFLVNGSSCGILAAINSVTDIGDKIIIERNCHKAVYNAVSIRDLQVEYLYPEFISEFGINGGIDTEKLENLLDEHSDTRAVVITSPTYDGIVSDIKSISDIVHKYGAVLIVDEAHGAHFNLSESLPKPAYKSGADLVIESVHKTLPSLTQTAVLHMCGSRVDTERIERSLSIYQTSSPSYVLMASVDRCIDVIESGGNDKMKNLLSAVDEFRENVNNLSFFHVPGKELSGKNRIFDIDVTKLIICVSPDMCNGKQLADILRTDYGFEMEMEAPGYVLGITTICDKLSEIKRLEKSLVQIEKRFVSERNIKIGNNNYLKKDIEFKLTENKALMSIYEAERLQAEPIGIEEAAGEISAEFLYLYPPGIPLLVPGEVISEQLLYQIKQLKKMRMNINGLKDKKIQYINILNR